MPATPAAGCPLANESVNAIVLQHVTTGDADQLLDECERVLMPAICG
jgi:hypothetical protein